MVFASVIRRTPPSVETESLNVPGERSEGGSGQRNNLGPKTSITVNAWAMLIVIGSVLAFAISMTWAASDKMHTIETATRENTKRIDQIERTIVTRQDLRDANGEALRAMQQLLGEIVIQCDKFGGDSKCVVMIPAAGRRP